ncbi:MAG: pirin family protein [Rhodospirillales bacterium]
MITTTPLENLGTFANDWLTARYHFSFANYYDPDRTGLGPLLVWNDDKIEPGRGFDPHGHRDMEIITYVRRGAITHEDNLGNTGRTEAGDVQVMSAGTGIRHAEFNREDEPTTLFQIWIQPDRKGIEPRWDARKFPKKSRGGKLDVLASGRPGDADTDALLIHQDAAVLGATLNPGEETVHVLGKGRSAYIVPASGSVTINGAAAPERSGTAVTAVDEIVIRADTAAEIVVVDLP